MNDPYTYLQNVTIPVAGEVAIQYRMVYPFYLYDITGVPSAAVGADLRLQIEDVSAASRFMSEPARSGLVAVDVPGKSAWLHPVEIPSGHIVQVRCLLRVGAPGVDFDLGLRGCHHLGVAAADCPSPRKGLYFYIWDFGDSLAAGTEVTKTIEVVARKDFIGLGWQALPSSSVVDSLTFFVKSQASGRAWSSGFQMGSSLFGDLCANVRRKPFPEPVRISSGDAVTIACRNTTAAPVLDVAVCMYGFHVGRGERL